MMNDAFSALQRMKASKVAQVSGVFAAPARASSTPSSPQLALVPPIPTLGALEALARRAEAGKDVVTDARRIASLPKWEYADLLARCQPGGDLDYTERFRVPGGTMTLKPIQNLALHWIEQKKGLVGPLAVGSGKCVAGNTEVYDLSRGRRVRVDELRTDLVVTSMDESTGRLHARAATSFPSGTKPCVCLSLAAGQSLTLSADHPVFTQRGWVHAADVLSTDLVATPRKYAAPETPLEVSDDEVLALAYFLANGGCTHGTTFTDDNEALVEEFTGVVGRIGVPDIRHKKVGVRTLPNRGKKATYLSVAGMKPFLRRWDIAHLSKHKRLPAEAYGMSDAHVALFVNRFWSSDGHIAVKRRVLELILASEGLVRDIQFLLLRLGISSRLSFKLAKFTHKGERKTASAWRLTVSGAGPVAAFFDRVGLLYGQEEGSATVLTAVRGTKTNTNVDIVPFGHEEFALLLEEIDLPANVGTSKNAASVRRTVLRKRLGITRGQYVGRDSFAQFCEEYGYAGRYAWLATSELNWERVRSVTPVGNEAVFDLSVDTTHNFVANGVVIHNTLLSLLAAPVMGAQRPVLMIPPALQLPLHHEIARLKKHFRIPLNLYIIPYSQLSVAKSTDLLEQLKPDLIIADECHSIRSPGAARTKRVLRYFRQFPQTRFIALSGTLTAKELKDYAHLCELALRDGSPVPLTEGDLLAWGNCIDANGTPQDKDWSIFAAFHDVRHLPHEARRDAARDAFRERFNSVPGVVATREASVACSLNLFERSIAAPTEVVHALMELHKTWTRPDGEEMDSALSLWRLGMQMSQGFYLRWVWPEGKVDHEWMEARSSWHREVRYVLQRNLGGMDSPLLVWNAVQRGQLDHPSIVRAFHAWSGQKHKPPPPTETVWISNYLVRDALAWHREHPKGIIWHSDLATENALRAAGVPTYGAGETPPLEGGRGGLALSIRVHGTGLNLQYAHHENLILSFPSSGKTMEQLLGRTHRQGQDADEVACWYYVHTDAARDAFRNARESARYIEQTQGSPQKLCYATYA